MLWTVQAARYTELVLSITLVTSDPIRFETPLLQKYPLFLSYLKINETPLLQKYSLFLSWLGLGLLWSVLVRGALLALGLLGLLVLCCWLLLVMKPAKRSWDSDVTGLRVLPRHLDPRSPTGFSLLLLAGGCSSVSEILQKHTSINYL